MVIRFPGIWCTENMLNFLAYVAKENIIWSYNLFEVKQIHETDHLLHCCQ